MPSRCLRLLAPLVLAGLTAGCPKVPSQTQTMRRAGLEVSGRELRTRSVDLGHYAAAVIEAAADSIAAVSADAKVQANALRWKAYVIPQVREAALRPDPLVGVVDLAALLAQLDQYFTTGDGRALFADQQPVAVAAVRGLRNELARVASLALGEQDSLMGAWRERVQTWAAQHPIGDSHYTRPSPIAEFKVLAGDAPGIGAVAASVENELRLLQERLAFLQDYGAADVAWSTTLGIQDAVGDETLDSLRALVAHSAGLAGTLPTLIHAEREALVEAVAAERIAVFREILLHRQAVLAALSSERAATMHDLGAERAIVLQAVSAERVATLAGIDSIVQRGLMETQSLVDHTLLILIVSEGLAIVLAGAVAFVVVRYAHPPA